MRCSSFIKKGWLLGLLLACTGVSVQARETVLFGSYEQDGNIENGAEDIEWEVLEKQGDRVLIFSKYILNNWRFHNSAPAGFARTWKDSSIRTKLNDDFLHTAFSEEEQANILETYVTTTNNEVWGTFGGADTTDKIFLLSLGELGKYYDITPSIQDDSDPDLITEPTSYAILNEALGIWWLRTPGMEFDGARMVNVLGNGTVNQNGGPVTSEEGVRPAMWINSSVLKNQTQKVQEALNDNGFDCGTPDGMVGGKTTEAVKAYQEANGLEQSGEINKELLLQLGIIENKVVESSEEDDTDTAEYEKHLLTEITLGNYAGYDTQWVVIDVDKTSALLLSKYVIEKRTYNDTRGDITWESCSMREWLNNDYLMTAFSDDERSSILLTHNYNTGGPETDDYIYLLSTSEARRLCQLSKDVYIACAEENTTFDHDADKSLHETKVGWGLRSLATEADGVVFINYAGEEKALYVDGNDAVRPAMRIDIEALERYRSESEKTIASQEEISETEDNQSSTVVSNETADIIASIDNDYPVDIIAVKMVRQTGKQDIIDIKIRKNFELAGDDAICVDYITVNNDGENVCDYGSAWVRALDQGQASWAHGNPVEDEILYEDLNYIKITKIEYFKDNTSYCLYPLPESIKVYKDDIVLEEK